MKLQLENAWHFLRAFLRWSLLAILVGAVCGLVGTAFHVCVNFATQWRGALEWLLYLLPVGGVVIVWLYHRLGQSSSLGTDKLFTSIQDRTAVPVAMAPLIFVATFLTHLLGGSAGREGAALQLGGSLGSDIGRLLKLNEDDRRTLTMVGMGALFAALFGTPLTATLFALEVISVGVFYYSALVPCIVASLVAYGISRAFGIAPTRFAILVEPLRTRLLLKVAVLAIACSVMSIVFCMTMHATEHFLAKKIPNGYLRIFLGGAAIVALTLLVGTGDYNGAGMDVIQRALEQGRAAPAAFLWKLVFTAITIGCGFKGGEVVPTFFIGATLGCVLGPLLGIPAGFAAAIGLVCVFCGAVNCPIASIALSVELFGSTELIYFALACGIAYMLSGYSGLYSSQKILYSKLRAEFINIHAK